MTWTVAVIVGPALAGLLLGNGLAHAWVACIVGGTAVASVLFLRPSPAPVAAAGRRAARGEVELRRLTA